MADTKPPFSFPQFNMPGFPYANLPEQLAASFGPPNGQFTNGSQYGRWNGVNNNAFGLFPDQFQSLFGSPAPQPMQFQPPYANNGYLGSNQGPGSNPGNQPPPPPSTPPPQSGPPPQQPLPGAVQGPGGTYPMPTSPQFIDPNRQPVGGIGAAPPGPPLTGTTSVPPSGFNPGDSNLKMAQSGSPQPGLLGSNFQNVLAQNPVAAFNLMVKNNPGMISQLEQAGYSPATINSYGAGGGSNYHPNSMLPGLNGGQSSYGVVLGQGGIPAGQSQQQHMQNLMTWRNQVQMAAMRGDNSRYQQLLASAPSGAQVINMGGPTGPTNTGRRA